MKNNQLFPFERNRYYAGKLLTSADFEAEQLYINNKRRFLNRVLFGSGVVCGLNVVSLDDLSILLESGVAIDGAGREIVVDAAVMKKLSELKGFDTLDGDRAGLYIRYREEAVHDVYCGDIGTDGKEYERNRIDEGYELYLKDAASIDTAEENPEDFILREMLMNNADYTVWLSMPCVVTRGCAVKMTVTIRKNSEKTKELSFHARLQMPAFTDLSGNHELKIEVDRLMPPKGQCINREYWICAGNTETDETAILCRKEDMQFQVGQYAVEPATGISLGVRLSNEPPFDLAAREIGKTSLDTELKQNIEEGVCIAALHFLRKDVSCLLSGVQECGVKHYIATPGKAKQRQLFLSYFTGKDTAEPGAEDDDVSTAAGIVSEDHPLPVACGKLEIPLDVNMKKGDVCVSEEIMHGLGKGNVYVDVGLEYINDSHKNTYRDTVYGNPELFGLHECMEVETAVRVLNDKGSFQVAAKLSGEQKSIVLRLNWVAVRFPSGKDHDEMQEEENRSIIPETPTVRLKAKESYFFNVQFHNLLPCRLSYELTEHGSGEISADGMYTAPAKEGVYEIYIYCTDMPKISTYAYAVVSRK